MKRVPPKYRFSIVIPCFDEANYIGSALKSLKKQDTTAKFEIIVVDNNCSDMTAEIARSYGAKIIKESRPGVCYARQAGTNAARGEIIVSTDADTTFDRSWLRRIDEQFNKDNLLVAVGGPCRYSDGPWWGKVYTHFLFGGSALHTKITGHPFYLTATNIAFKKSVWTGYNLEITQGGDELDLLHRLRKQGRVKFNNSNPTYTSARRLEKGMFYNIFVTYLFYYLGAYYLDRMFNRPIIGSAPAFRQSGTQATRNRIALRSTLISVSVLAIIIISSHTRNFVVDNVNDTVAFVKDTVKIISTDLQV